MTNNQIDAKGVAELNSKRTQGNYIFFGNNVACEQGDKSVTIARCKIMNRGEEKIPYLAWDTGDVDTDFLEAAPAMAELIAKQAKRIAEYEEAGCITISERLKNQGNTIATQDEALRVMRGGLNFYANGENYETDTELNNGNFISLTNIDRGITARKALAKANSLIGGE